MYFHPFLIKITHILDTHITRNVAYNLPSFFHYTYLQCKDHWYYQFLWSNLILFHVLAPKGLNICETMNTATKAHVAHYEISAKII